MLPNLILTSQLPDPEKNTSLSNLGTELVKKSKLTKGMYFYLIFYIIYSSVFLLLAVAPTIVVIFRPEARPPVPAHELLVGFFIFTVIGVLYFGAYAGAELRDKWKK